MSPSSTLAVIALAAAVAPSTWGGLPDPQTCEPQQLARSGGGMGDVAVYSERAYVAASEGGLLVYDVSNPAAMSEVARIGEVVPIRVKIDGEVGALFEQLGLRLRVFTLDDPLAPDFESIIPYQLGVFGGFDIQDQVLVMGEGNRLRIYDIADPASPALLANTNSVLVGLESARDIVIDGERIAIALGSIQSIPDSVRGVRFADFTDPKAPVRGALFSVPDFNGTLACVNGICVLTRAVGTGFELVVLDVTDVQNPILLGTTPSPEAGDIAIVGEIVHVASRSRDTTYATFSIANPSQPTHLGDFVLNPDAGEPLSNRAWAIAFTDDAAMVVLASSALGAMDVSDPTSPQLISQTFGANGARALAFSDGVAFVSDFGELRAIDLSQPDQPVGIYRDPLISRAREIDMGGDLLAAACDIQGTVIYNITDPRTPERLVSIPPLLAPSARAKSVSIQPDRLYIVEDYSLRVLRIFDISDPQAPVKAGVISEKDMVLDRWAFSGNFAFLPVVEGVNIWNLEDPQAPELVGVIVRDLVSYIDVDGSLLAISRYVGTGSPRPSVVELFDISDPASPVSLSETMHSNPWSPQIKITGDRLIMLTSNEAVYDIADPRAPRLISSSIHPFTYGTLYPRIGAYSEGSLLLLGTQDYLYIFDLSPCILGCAADADNSGLVDMADLNLVISAFNAFPADPNWIAEADLDGDGQVTFADLNLVVASLHTDCDPAP